MKYFKDFIFHILYDWLGYLNRAVQRLPSKALALAVIIQLLLLYLVIEVYTQSKTTSKYV